MPDSPDWSNIVKQTNGPDWSNVTGVSNNPNVPDWSNIKGILGLNPLTSEQTKKLKQAKQESIEFAKQLPGQIGKSLESQAISIMRQMPYVQLFGMNDITKIPKVIKQTKEYVKQPDTLLQDMGNDVMLGGAALLPLAHPLVQYGVTGGILGSSGYQMYKAPTTEEKASIAGNLIAGFILPNIGAKMYVKTQLKPRMSKEFIKRTTEFGPLTQEEATVQNDLLSGKSNSDLMIDNLYGNVPKLFASKLKRQIALKDVTSPEDVYNQLVTLTTKSGKQPQSTNYSSELLSKISNEIWNSPEIQDPMYLKNNPISSFAQGLYKIPVNKEIVQSTTPVRTTLQRIKASYYTNYLNLDDILYTLDPVHQGPLERIRMNFYKSKENYLGIRDSLLNESNTILTKMGPGWGMRVKEDPNNWAPTERMAAALNLQSTATTGKGELSNADIIKSDTKIKDLNLYDINNPKNILTPPEQEFVRWFLDISNKNTPTNMQIYAQYKGEKPLSGMVNYVPRELLNREGVPNSQEDTFLNLLINDLDPKRASLPQEQFIHRNFTEKTLATKELDLDFFKLLKHYIEKTARIQGSALSYKESVETFRNVEPELRNTLGDIATSKLKDKIIDGFLEPPTKEVHPTVKYMIKRAYQLGLQGKIKPFLNQGTSYFPSVDVLGTKYAVQGRTYLLQDPELNGHRVDWALQDNILRDRISDSELEKSVLLRTIQRGTIGESVNNGVNKSIDFKLGALRGMDKFQAVGDYLGAFDKFMDMNPGATEQAGRLYAIQKTMEINPASMKGFKPEVLQNDWGRVANMYSSQQIRIQGNLTRYMADENNLRLKAKGTPEYSKIVLESKIRMGKHVLNQLVIPVLYTTLVDVISGSASTMAIKYGLSDDRTKKEIAKTLLVNSGQILPIINNLVSHYRFESTPLTTVLDLVENPIKYASKDKPDFWVLGSKLVDLVSAPLGLTTKQERILLQGLIKNLDGELHDWRTLFFTERALGITKPKTIGLPSKEQNLRIKGMPSKFGLPKMKKREEEPLMKFLNQKVSDTETRNPIFPDQVGMG